MPEPGKDHTVNGEPGKASPPHAKAVDAHGDGEALVDIVLRSAETMEVASAIKALVPLLPIDLSEEIAVDKRALALIA
ncbi:MAG TPA: hypothetical protein VLT35_07505, partial [Methanocella sp.]|nr:hypothetical protein [Methanocella sp.]